MSLRFLCFFGLSMGLSLSLPAAPVERPADVAPVLASPTLTFADPADPKADISPRELVVVEKLVGPPANDNFTGAIDIPFVASSDPTPPFPRYGDNIDATKEPGEPNHEGKPGGHSVWWKWTPTSHVRAQIYASSTGFTPLLGVYTGSAVNALNPVPRDPYTVPQPASAYFYAIAGTTYYIAVDGADNAFGDFQFGVGYFPAKAPVITQQPADVSIAVTTDGRLDLVVNGTEPLTAQWFHNGIPTDFPSGPAGIYISRAKPSDAGEYHAIVSNPWGSVTSAKARVTVTGTAITITAQPESQIKNIGEEGMFRVTATGTGASLEYQWSFNGVPIPNGKGSLLYVPNVKPSDAGTYTVTVFSPYGSVTSQPATLTVGAANPPVITVHPINQAARAGGGVTFSVTATSTAPLSYVWNFNGVPIQPIVNSPYLQLTNLQPANVGSYSVTVSNAVGSVLSQSATLQVDSPPVAQPSTGSSGGGGGGAPSAWFLAALAILLALRRQLWLRAR